MRDILEKTLRGENLTRSESASLFSAMARGEMDPVQISAFLAALKVKGEQPDEIAGAAEALRESAVPFPRPSYDFADSCGTGGTGADTFNISTAAALVAAEMGVPVVKHGNRALSSSSGSADVLEKLGVNIDASPETSRRCLDALNICFLFAPKYHPGLKHAMPVRKALGVRTIFNILGPLVNPGRPGFQVMGVYDPELVVPIAETFNLLGCTSALVVHGSGLDEIALHGPTRAALLKDGHMEKLEITPEDAGLSSYPLERLKPLPSQDYADCLLNLLRGKGDEAHATAAALNAGALAWIFGRAPDLKSACKAALNTIGSGRAAQRLEAFARMSHGA